MVRGGCRPEGIDDQAEVPLAGGTLTAVVRVGATVRRPPGPWTPTVHALLHHLRTRDFPLAPEPLGYDDRGREILTYLPGATVGGSMPWPDWVWDEALLADVGRVVARLHVAAADFRPAGIIPWFDGPQGLGLGELVCHQDLAPYNVVVADGAVAGIVDWDLAGPTTARSDLAFVAWQWVPLHDPWVTEWFGWRKPPNRGRRLRVLLDAYGLAERDGFVDEIVARIAINRERIVRGARAGVEAFVRLKAAGHVVGMDRALAFLAEKGPELQSEVSRGA